MQEQTDASASLVASLELGVAREESPGCSPSSGTASAVRGLIGIVLTAQNETRGREVFLKERR